VCRFEVDQSARGGRAHFRFRVLLGQAVELRRQNFSHAILETRSLDREPLIEGWCNPVEISEEALAIRLEEIAGIRGRVGAPPENCKYINPTFPGIDSDALSTDLYEPRNMAINNAV
jgi:hypothetical protein